MCLAVPGKIIEWVGQESPFRSAKVEFGGVQRIVSMECVPDAEVGDYILVHAGIAISKVAEDEAEKILSTLLAALESENANVSAEKRPS